MNNKSHFSQVVDVLRLESQAIAETAARLNAADVERVVGLLVACRGKIVILGVGKSGIIAQKIAATMTSTGSAAINLHPSDALHGGMGDRAVDHAAAVRAWGGRRTLLPRLAAPLRAAIGDTPQHRRTDVGGDDVRRSL